jgi:hypothetical protein
VLHCRIVSRPNCSPCPPAKQVLWTSVVAAVELKAHLSTSDHKEAMGQLQSRAEVVFKTQPGRIIFYGIAGDGRSVEVVVFRRTEGGLRHHRTGLQTLDRSEQSPGLYLLARLLLSPPAALGYKPLVMVHRWRRVLGRARGWLLSLGGLS